LLDVTPILTVPTRILIVDDEPRFRDSFSDIIRREPTFTLAAACATAGEAFTLMQRETFDVALVDLGLPDASGLEVIRALKGIQPQCDVMVISVFGDEDLVLASIEGGATGYLLKDSLPAQFVACIQELLAGGAPISPMIARLLLNRVRPGAAASTPASPVQALDLSERELEILRIVAKGFSLAEIAGLLSISINTVKTYVRRIYQKLTVTSRSEAIYEANRMGLLGTGVARD
jgi:DNA-binding NarL/FixJ family response regulator